MKSYDYFRDTWPVIVRDCFAHGRHMFAVVEMFDGLGRVVEYGQGRELDEAAALEFRGATVVVYDDQNVTEGKSCG